MIYGINPNYKAHERTKYALFDLLGDFGGVMQVLFLIGEYLLSAYAENNFLIKAFQKLYMARTNDSTLF